MELSIPRIAEAKARQVKFYCDNSQCIMHKYGLAAQEKIKEKCISSADVCLWFIAIYASADSSLCGCATFCQKRPGQTLDSLCFADSSHCIWRPYEQMAVL